jgi:hypothetical protein
LVAMLRLWTLRRSGDTTHEVPGCCIWAHEQANKTGRYQDRPVISFRKMQFAVTSDKVTSGQMKTEQVHHLESTEELQVLVV